MKVEIFPSGGVHSVYLDMINNPPDDIIYFGNYKHSNESVINSRFRSSFMRVADYFQLPYVISYNSDVDIIHSSQKILNTKNNYVIDIEHGNPFMGSDKVFKYEWAHFRFLVRKYLLKNNCRKIIPWTNKAMEAFKINFSFLGDGFFKDKVEVIYPAVKYVGMHENTDIPTFTFVAGSTWDTFYTKGGVDVLRAAKILEDYGFEFKINFISSNIPDMFRKSLPKSVVLYEYMSRNDLMKLLFNSDFLLLPSLCDTFGISILEAKAMGVPTIGFNSFAASEIIGTGGVVFDSALDIERWFDEFGRKVMNKSKFHGQFKYPTGFGFLFDLGLAGAMFEVLSGNRCVYSMKRNCLDDINSGGRFSLSVRNKKIKEIYEK